MRGHYLCNEDCNHCKALYNPQLHLLLNTLLEIYEDEEGTFAGIVGSICPNFTCCSDCRIDDFCHDDGCDIEAKAKQLARRFRREFGIGKRKKEGTP